MNIYATDSDPVLCAEYLDDKRLIKAVTDVAVLLSTALYSMGCTSSKIYLPKYDTHPWAKWVQQARGNFEWLVLHGLALNQEMRYRFPDMTPKVRSTSVILDCSEIFSRDCRLDTSGMSAFPDCSNVSGNISTVKKYRLLMSQTKWGFQTRWTRRGMPDWHKAILPKETA